MLKTELSCSSSVHLDHEEAPLTCRLIVRRSRGPSITQQEGPAGSPLIGGGLVESLGEIPGKYQAKVKTIEAAIPDFTTFRLGLNVASADQRVHVLVTGRDDEIRSAHKTLPALGNDVND